MAQKVLSIYIGNDVIRICEVNRTSSKHVNLSGAFEIPTPLDCVEDGQITDHLKIAEAMKGCLSDKRFLGAHIVFTVYSKKIANKEVLLPYVKNAKRVDDMIKANAADYFPMNNLNDYLIAVSVLEIVQVENMKNYRVSAIAVPKEIIESYYVLAEELKMPIDNIDYFGNSVLQLLSLQMKEGTQLIIQMEIDSTVVNIMSGSTLILQRSVPYGKNAVISALVDIEGITEAEAKTLLDSKEELDKKVTTEEYHEAVRYLIGSIVRIVEYYTSRQDAMPLDEIKVFGEGSNIAGIEELLENEFNATVSRFDEMMGVTVKRQEPIQQEELLRYIANIGAVIAPMNLTIDGVTGSKKISTDLQNLLYGGIILASAVSIIMVAIPLISYFSLMNDKKVLEAEITSIGTIEETYNLYLSTKGQFEVLQSYYASTENDNEMAYQFLLDLEEIMPASVGITSLSVDNGSVSASMVATGKLAVADFITQIKSLPYIDSVWVPNISETTDIEGISTDVFTLSCVFVETVEEVVTDETE